MGGWQEGLVVPLQTAATANGNGQNESVSGFNGVLNVEIVETAGGTATVTLEGWMSTAGGWHALGYQQIDGQASLSRAATGISVTANMSKVFQILDPYPTIRARISSIAGGASVNVTLYKVSA